MTRARTLRAALWRRLFAGVRVWRIRRSIARCASCHRFKGQLSESTLVCYHELHSIVDRVSSQARGMGLSDRMR